LENLDEVIALPPLYPLWAQCLFNAMSSAGVAGLFFGGGWYDVAVSFGLGLVVSFCGKVATRPFDKVFEFLAALMVACVTRLIVWAGLPICYQTTALSSIIFLVQV
jgi:uncharacterized membrane protein YjjP (DUF1212 family)